MAGEVTCDQQSGGASPYWNCCKGDSSQPFTPNLLAAP
jgi:hypothetical protein